MKNNLSFAKAAILTMIILFGMNCATMAAAFTATTSGNWSSPTTWGLNGPGFNITGANTITIPLGVTVTMDSNLTINNALTTLTVTGALTGSTALNITAGTLSGTGRVTANSLTVGAAGYITSVDTINVTQFTNSQATLALTAVLNVSNTVILSAGVLQLNTGGAVNLANNATINMAGGSYSIVAGLLNLAGSFNLLYTGTATTVGLETMLLGLQNVTVNLPATTSQLSLSGNLAVAGVLSLQQGTLSLNGNSLTINGTINTAAAGSISGTASSNIIVNGTGSVGTIALATGGQTINNLTLNIGAGGSVSLASNAIVGGALSLNGSSLNLNGYNLTIAGTVSASGAGSIIGNGNSNLTVSGAGDVGTLMFSASGNTLGSLTINVGSTDSVLLGSNVIVSGTLALSGGRLNLNGQSLTIGGAVNATGSGSISGSATSNITLNGTGNAGTLVFTAGSQAINNLTVNIGSTGMITLGSGVTVGGTLTLAQGNISIGNNNLTIAATGSVQGGSLSSYIVTNGTGSLVMTIANAAATGMFQVGTLANYAPVTVTNNSTASGAFSVIAHPGVLAAGITGADISTTQSVVNTSWEVSSSLTTGANINLQMFWNTVMQVNGFNNAYAYISHYTGGAWNASALAAATAHAGGTFSLTLTGVTSFSPFAVFDRNTVTAVAELKPETTFHIYPNPAADLLSVTVQETGFNATLKIFDALGNEVITKTLVNATTPVDISGFAPGIYFASLNNTLTKQFIKK